MPINGLGTYSLLDNTCVESVKTALKDGVRLIDTAYLFFYMQMETHYLYFMEY